MRSLLTATNLEKLHAILSEQQDIKMLNRDIEYQEELFNKLAVMDPEVLLIEDKLPGPFTKYELFEEILKLQKPMKIICILRDSSGDGAFKKFLRDRGIRDQFCMEDSLDELFLLLKYEDPVKEEIKDIKVELENGKKEEEVPAEFEKVYIRKEILTLVTPGGGGLGKTTMAINIGVVAAIKYKKAKVIIVDYSEEKADLARSLNMDEDNGLEAIAKCIKEEKLNEKTIFNSIKQYSNKIPNLFILPGIKRLINTDVFNLSDFRYIIDSLKKEFDFIIIDTGRFKSAATHAAIERATRVFFMVRDTENSLTAAKEKINFYENDLATSIKEKTDIFCNMMIGINELDNNSIYEIFKKKPIAEIGYNSKIIVEGEKYNPFIMNKNFKEENKQIENVVNSVFKYGYIEGTRSNKLIGLLRGRGSKRND